MKAKEHAARAMLLGMWYDAYTSTYRYRSWEGSNYGYSGVLNAYDLAPLMMPGYLREVERAYFGHTGKTNSVSNRRLGLDGKE